MKILLYRCYIWKHPPRSIKSYQLTTHPTKKPPLYLRNFGVDDLTTTHFHHEITSTCHLLYIYVNDNLDGTYCGSDKGRTIWIMTRSV